MLEEMLNYAVPKMTVYVYLKRFVEWFVRGHGLHKDILLIDKFSIVCADLYRDNSNCTNDFYICIKPKSVCS